MHQRSNPFATRFTRPGEIPFFFLHEKERTPRSTDIRTLADRLEEFRWCQIIGPHGSGKSTLLATLIPFLTRHDWQVEHHLLRQGQRRIAIDYEKQTVSESSLIVIDGFEQLGWWNRRSIIRRVKREQRHLLVTAHRDMGLPTLFETTSSMKSLKKIIAHLLGSDASIIDDRLPLVSDKHGGNVREALFELYDDWDTLVAHEKGRCKNSGLDTRVWFAWNRAI